MLNKRYYVISLAGKYHVFDSHVLACAEINGNRVSAKTLSVTFLFPQLLITLFKFRHN